MSEHDWRLMLSTTAEKVGEQIQEICGSLEGDPPGFIAWTKMFVLTPCLTKYPWQTESKWTIWMAPRNPEDVPAAQKMGWVSVCAGEDLSPLMEHRCGSCDAWCPSSADFCARCAILTDGDFDSARKLAGGGEAEPDAEE